MTISLALRYRPKTWEDVVGQETTVKILSNQVKHKDIRQSYLFVGAAGCGKTSCARIFASALNGSAGGTTELDAASNNGVDAVRALREECQLKPLATPYRVYILDEVHQLSTGAFNALLKTLEEPPSHAVFILCTTDPQKIPATVMSRLQRFDFTRITTKKIQSRIKDIAVKEKFVIDDESAKLIAIASRGGLRDALTILDMCVANARGDGITADTVRAILGVSDAESYARLFDALFSKNVKQVFYEVDSIFESGRDLALYARGFLDFLLDLKKWSYTKNLSALHFNILDKETLDTLTIKMRDANIDWRKWFTELLELNNVIKYEKRPKELIEGALLCLI